MKLLTLFLSLFSLSFSLAQETKLPDSPIEVSQIAGNWYNMATALTKSNQTSYSKKLGSLSDSKMSIPTQNVASADFIGIMPDGRFLDMSYPNAKWKLVNNRFIVTKQFGDELLCFLSKDDVTGEYRLTVGGQIFKKKNTLVNSSSPDSLKH